MSGIAPEEKLGHELFIEAICNDNLKCHLMDPSLLRYDVHNHGCYIGQLSFDRQFVRFGNYLADIDQIWDCSDPKFDPKELISVLVETIRIHDSFFTTKD